MDEAHASLRYLRTAQEHDQQRLQQSRERLHELARTRDDLDHRDRLRRSMERLNRLHEASAQASAAAAAAAAQSSNMAASAQYGERVPAQNSLYDWAPSIDLDDDDARSLRTLQSRLGLTSHPDSLRSTAILQAVRRHPRFSARTREYLQRYSHDRDRDRDRATGDQPPSRDTASQRRS